MKTAVQRWGNSLALRIPRAYAAETRISEGTEVELTLKSGALVVRPVLRKRHALADLLKRVTSANRHDSIETGSAVGKEVW
jgi:antitoxin MazE